MWTLPKQRLSYAKKSANDFEWAKRVADSIIASAPPFTNNRSDASSEYNRKLANYQLYNNQINQKLFEKDCNPLGIDAGQYADTVQPYNKTYNKIQILISDLSKRPFNFKSILTNADGIRSKLAYRDASTRGYFNSLIKQTMSLYPSLYPQDLVESIQSTDLPPDEIERDMRYNYRERREILSDKIISYLHRALDLKDIMLDTFKHGLISGDEIVYIGTSNGEPTVTAINPLEFFYHKGGSTKWVQKSAYAGTITKMPKHRVLELYTRYLTDDQKAKLDDGNDQPFGVQEFKMEQNAKYGHDTTDPLLSTNFNQHSTYGKVDATDVTVTHVEWVSQRKVGFLSYIDANGEQNDEIVSEDFTIPTTFTKETITYEYGAKTTYYIWMEEDRIYKLNWDYIPEVWTATKIGNDIYTKIGPKLEQFRSIDNPYDVSLGYHGVVYSDMNAESVSLMDRMRPFQYLYFIVMHKLKKLIAQDQGKVFHFDISMVDPKIGLEKTLYYLREMNIDLFNPLANADEPGQAQRGKVTGESDMSVAQHILNYINLLASIDAQISEVAGVSRQREGQITPTEAVGNAQTNVQMSALITEVYFHLHSKLWEKILTSLVSITKEAWRGKNIIKQYVLDDMSLATLELSTDELDDCDLGVFITDSGKEYEMFQALKMISDGLLNTNRATFSDLITLYEANTAAELKAAITQSEQQAQQREAQAQQAELQAQAQQQQAQHEFELLKQEREYEFKKELAEIEVFKFQKDIDIDNNGIPDPLEVEKFISDQKNKEDKLELEKKKLEVDTKLREKELKIKAKKSSKNT